MRWLKRWLGYDAEPLVKIVGGLRDPEAEMWAQLLRNDGIAVLVKSSSPLVGYLATRTLSDFDIYVRASDAARALGLLAPLLQTREDSGGRPRQPRP